MEFRFVKGYKKTAITYLPKEVFEQKYQVLVKEILNDLGGVEEGKIFLQEWKYRNKFDELFLKNLIICDYDQLSDEIAEWVMCGIRPEQIILALIMHFNTYIDELNLHKYYSEEELHKLFNEINNNVIKFNQECAELYQCKYNDYNYIAEQYDKYKPTGLGFNLITTSASKALLFQSLNASTVDKQIGQNARAKRYAISQYADSKANERYTQVSKLYNDFARFVLNEIDNSLKLLKKMKKKCTKADILNEEKKKQLRHHENENKKVKMIEEMRESDSLYKQVLKESEPETLRNAKEFAKKLWIFVIILILFLWLFVFRQI